MLQLYCFFVLMIVPQGYGPTHLPFPKMVRLRNENVVNVHFLSGSLPAPALLHIHQFTLLHMIAKLGQSSILFQHAIHVLHFSIPNSWFTVLRSLATQYTLPDPLHILVSPPLKQQFKSLVKSAVKAFWHRNRPDFLPLGQGPHPLWWSCRSSPSSVRAATVQAKMLSGRYRSCWLRRHWTQESGACRLPGCNMIPGDVAHILCGECTAIKPALAQALRNIEQLLSPYPLLLPPVVAALQSDRETFTTFILDPSTDAAVISLVQHQGSGILYPLFSVSRAWVWAAHRTRMRLLGLERYLE